MSNDNLERARRYIEKAGGAVSGNSGHAHTFALACNLLKKISLSESELYEALATWHNPQCDPPWNEKELRHKVSEAIKATPQDAGMRSDSGFNREEKKGRPYIIKTHDSNQDRAESTAATGIRFVYRGNSERPIPEPMNDAARRLISTAFRENEGIRIVHAHFDEEGKERPGSGISMTRENWLARLDSTDGHVNDGKGMFLAEGNPGVYISINPIEPGQTKDAAITQYRHALLEFDEIEREKQWPILVESNLPITAVIDSGRRSLHAWVRVDAVDREEYDQRVNLIYNYMAEYKPDDNNKNPGRLSRLPGAIRMKSRQTLLALNIGVGTFAEWMAERALDGVGQPLSIDELLAFDPDNDPNTILGNRFLCKGGSLLIVAPSGVGKSTLATQAAVTWAMGQHLFGIRPVRPLKSLIIQAENDFGDIAQQFRGALTGMNIDPDEHIEQMEAIRNNIVYVRDTIHTAEAFCSVVAKLVDRYKPDLVFVDPLLSFLGGDVSSQEVCSRFLRNGLNPIAESTGVVFIIIHHTAKPPKEKAKSIEGWTTADFAYLGAGSHEITNWARAVIVLQQQPDSDRSFQLGIVKRGRRAGATTLSGEETISISLRHSERGLSWIQTREEDASDTKSVASDTRPWFVKKWPGFDPQAIWCRMPKIEDLTVTELAAELQSHARLKGAGPTGNSAAAGIVRDLLEIDNGTGSGIKVLTRYAANGKRGSRVKDLYRVNLAPEFVKLRNDPRGFDDFPAATGGESQPKKTKA